MKKPSRHQHQVALATRIRELVTHLVALLVDRGRRPRSTNLVHVLKALQALPPDPELRAAFRACSDCCWQLAATAQPWAEAWVGRRRDFYASLGLETGDVVSEMLFGLYKAAWCWRPERGTAYLTIASPYARVRAQRMAMIARSPVHIPFHVSVAALRADALAHYGLSAAEISQELGPKPAQAARLARPTIVRLDAPAWMSDESGDTLTCEVIPSLGASPEDLVAEADAEAKQFEAIAAALVSGSTRTAEVVDRRLGLSMVEPETLSAIGDDLGLSRERVRQIEQAGLRHLRASPKVARALGREARL